MKASSFDSTAATQYFKSKTKSPLIGVYAPKIDKFLDEPLLGKKSGESFSPNDAFNSLKTKYNDAYDLLMVAIEAEKLTASLLGTPIADEYNKTNLKPITTNSLGEFSTDKALDGLFFKVGKEEIKIRRDPWQYLSNAVTAAAKEVGEILVKVFGEGE